MNFRYRPELNLTLKSIEIYLKPGEHVGIVGRTGAGKSSLVTALCRLAEPEAGSQIEVEGVNTLALGLTCARRAFAVIPQEPFLFAGTLRENLSAGTHVSDAEMWGALERV